MTAYDNLKNMKFEAHFAEERSKLFHCRKNFFLKHFPLRDYDGETKSLWTCNLNVTRLWPRVATFACCFPPPKKNRFGYLQRLKSVSNSKRIVVWNCPGGQRFDLSPSDFDRYSPVTKDKIRNMGKYVHLALKNPMAYGLPLDTIPETVQKHTEKVLAFS